MDDLLTVVTALRWVLVFGAILVGGAFAAAAAAERRHLLREIERANAELALSREVHRIRFDTRFPATHRTGRTVTRL